MASIFWDAHCILFIDYLEKGKTINSDYYMALLDGLSVEIKKKWPQMQKRKLLFHEDNAPCHKSMKTMVKLNELSFQLLLRLPYSPDLAPHALGKEIWLQWWSDCRNWSLFWEQRQIILQKRHQKVREVLEWMYYIWRKLCWWIKSNFSKKLCFS